MLSIATSVPPDTDERAGLVVTGKHPFWVKDVGWARADYLEPGQLLELADGRTCQIFNSSTVYRTDVEGVGWDEIGSGAGRRRSPACRDLCA
jgi:hypothetical protein